LHADTRREDCENLLGFPNIAPWCSFGRLRTDLAGDNPSREKDIFGKDTMTKVNIHQAKTQFSRLVNLAAGGEEIIIAKAGKAVARLVPYQPKGVIRRRRPGAMRGKIKIKRNFDDPLPKELLASFNSKS